MSVKRTLQLSVIQRMFTQEQMDHFLKEYESNKSPMGGHRTRFEAMKEPLTEADLNLLKDFVNEEISIKELLIKHNLTYNQYMAKLKSVATKFVFQKRDLL